MKLLVISVLTVCAIACGYLVFGDEHPGEQVSHSTVTGSVESIIDGDTFKLKVGSLIMDVELIGVDAPEFGQRFAEHARNHLSDLVRSREVTVELYGLDSNGRLQGELFSGGISINRLMLTDGFVWANPDCQEYAFWTGLEHAARNQRFGLWRDDVVIPPWEFREHATSISETGTR